VIDITHIFASDKIRSFNEINGLAFKFDRLLGRGLTRIGIIGLVDEATGHQRDRADNALAKILEEFIAKELQPYIPTFTSEFYQEIFRLRGLEYPKDSVKRPQYFGGITNDIVYKRLAPGILEELRAVTPRLSSGRLSKKLFQRLTKTRGYPKLREHLGAVLTMMQLSDDWQDFMRKLNRLRPHQILRQNSHPNCHSITKRPRTAEKAFSESNHVVL
jgi:hypothetical protein